MSAMGKFTRIKTIELNDKRKSEDREQVHSCIKEMKHWVQNEAKFYGRTDDEFLLMFLRSCDFDIQLTKDTLICYYECRRDLPNWWANKNVRNSGLYSLLHLKTITALLEKDGYPTVKIIDLSRFDRNMGNFDQYMKLMSIASETTWRRRTNQLNGEITILDCRNYKWWFGIRMLSPIFAKNFLRSFSVGSPIKSVAFITVSAPPAAAAFTKIFQQFLPDYLKNQLHVIGSDWSELGRIVPLEVLPSEYGGQAGPFEEHENAFIKEILDFNDYLVNDNQFGYQNIY